MKNRKIDCTKLECPMPVIKAKQELEKYEEVVLEVLVDNDVAVQNLTKLANSLGCKSDNSKQENNFVVTIEKTKQSCECDGVEKRLVVDEAQTILIKTCNFGVGNDDLGATLMKGFIFAITQSKPLPKKIMFLNSGVKLTTENEDTIKNLLILEKEGTEIVSCGTCLDFYNLKDKLKVGTIGNMYDIVNSLNISNNKFTI